MKAFTLLEVIILLVVFLMVALLIIPLSVDDTIQARNISRWKQTYATLQDMPTTVKSISGSQIELQTFLAALIKDYPLKNVVSYKIKYMNGDSPQEMYKFKEIYETDLGATIAFKWLNPPKNDMNDKKIIGVLMYDVNGKQRPNIWGKDIFGINIYSDSVKPFGREHNSSDVQFDCSKQGSGLFCSSYYLDGGAY